MFVRRDGLLGELSADPVGFFRQNNRASSPGRSKCSGTTAYTAANDDEISALLAGAGFFRLK
jgi:hypothetical protein